MSARSHRTLRNHPLVHSVRSTIRLNKLIPEVNSSPIIVALSGGADSTALLWVLSLLGYSVVAAHCNFHLRGEESDRDEDFVRSLCATLQIPLYVQQCDTLAYRDEHPHMSIEMAARELRYDFLYDLLSQINAQYIAVGHHLEDNIEQLLLGLARGAGVRGLRGMLPCRPAMRGGGIVIRPMINVSPREIYDFLATAGQSFVEDSSNASIDFLRNYVRHEIRPHFDGLNRSFDRAVAASLSHLRELERIYDDYLTHHLASQVFDDPNHPRLSCAWLQTQAAPGILLYETFSAMACDRDTLLQISEHLSDSTPARYEGRGGIVERYRGWLVGTPQATLDRLAVAGQTRIDIPYLSVGDSICLHHPLGAIHVSLIEPCAESPNWTVSPDECLIDYDAALAQGTQLRFCPVSNEGTRPMQVWGVPSRHKRIDKLLRDAHLLPSCRSAVPLLIDVTHDEVLWVAGVARGIAYPVTDHTHRILRLRIELSHFTRI